VSFEGHRPRRFAAATRAIQADLGKGLTILV
jgi:hypothetical protein